MGNFLALGKHIWSTSETFWSFLKCLHFVPPRSFEHQLPTSLFRILYLLTQNSLGQIYTKVHGKISRENFHHFLSMPWEVYNFLRKISTAPFKMLSFADADGGRDLECLVILLFLKFSGGRLHPLRIENLFKTVVVWHFWRSLKSIIVWLFDTFSYLVVWCCLYKNLLLTDWQTLKKCSKQSQQPVLVIVNSSFIVHRLLSTRKWKEISVEFLPKTWCWLFHQLSQITKTEGNFQKLSSWGAKVDGQGSSVRSASAPVRAEEEQMWVFFLKGYLAPFFPKGDVNNALRIL